MKKILALILSLAMILSMSAFAFADTYSNYNTADSWQDNNSESQNVTVDVREADTVYHVVVAWGNLTFTYTVGNWNPETHEYEDCKWTGTPATVTVTNHSNADVNSKVEIEKADIDGLEIISECGVENNAESYTRALGRADTQDIMFGTGTPAAMTVTISPDGQLENPNDVADGATLATVKVTISAPTP